MTESLLRTNEEFIQIYNRNFDMVYHLCLMYLKSDADALDATQNTFLKLYEKQPIFTDLNHEKAWLILTSKRVCFNNLKHWWNKVSDILKISEPSYTTQKDQTLECLMNLPLKYKNVLYLHYYAGYKTSEIAIILKMNESTVRSDLLRGRKLLGEMIKEEGDYE